MVQEVIMELQGVRQGTGRGDGERRCCFKVSFFMTSLDFDCSKSLENDFRTCALGHLPPSGCFKES